MDDKSTKTKSTMEDNQKVQTNENQSVNASYKKWGIIALALASIICIGWMVFGNPWMEQQNDFHTPTFEKPELTDRFDGDQAMKYLKNICSIGTRITDTEGFRIQLDYVKKHFDSLGAEVEVQTFEAKQFSTGSLKYKIQNLIVRWDPSAKERILIGCHYDTRPFADKEVLPRKRNQPFLGANDGASGVAFFMELGRSMKNIPRRIGVDFVLFDAEEMIFDKDQDDYFIGSLEFARRYAKEARDFEYKKILVIDMIADKDLNIYQDQYSMDHAEGIVREIWGIAKELKVPEFINEEKYIINDDHTSFHEFKIPAALLIDFDYPHWHRITDTPENCSGESMEKVAKVLVEWIKRQS